MTRYAIWGDRQHWDIALGRFSLVRWCKVGILSPGTGCQGRHPIRLIRYRRSGASRFDT